MKVDGDFLCFGCVVCLELEVWCFGLFVGLYGVGEFVVYIEGVDDFVVDDE